MTSAILYVVIAILMIVVAALLARERRPNKPSRRVPGEYPWNHTGSGEFLKISDRIFDSSDFRWLRDEVGRADLARGLARSRKQLAIQWLETLRDSFNELVRTPEPTPLGGQAKPAAENLRPVWLTIRFHLLLGYALFVVRTLGPYHRLLPTLSWLHILPQVTSPRNRLTALD